MEVHSSQPDPIDENIDENINPESEFWGPMQKGNRAVCEGNFTWTKVDKVILHDEETFCQFSIDSVDALSTSFGPASFTFGNVTLPVKVFPNVENFAPKARELVRLVAHLTDSLESNYVQFTRSYQDSCGDSDGEQVPDPAVEAPFTDAEWDSIVFSFKMLRKMYTLAKKNNFENAHGKYFLEDLIKFCCCGLNEQMRQYIRHGTSRSGERQPGCCQWIKEVVRADPSTSVATPDLPSSDDLPSSEEVRGKRKASNRSPSSPPPSKKSKGKGKASTSRDKASQSTSPKKKTIHFPTKAYSDVCVWDPSKLLYVLSAEVKSVEIASVEEQSSNQMFGLFRNNQKASLGLILKPETIQIYILVRNVDELILHKLTRVLSTTTNTTYKLLCRIIISFFFFVDY